MRICSAPATCGFYLSSRGRQITVYSCTRAPRGDDCTGLRQLSPAANLRSISSSLIQRRRRRRNDVRSIAVCSDRITSNVACLCVCGGERSDRREFKHSQIPCRDIASGGQIRIVNNFFSGSWSFFSTCSHKPRIVIPRVLLGEIALAQAILLITAHFM